MRNARAVKILNKSVITKKQVGQNTASTDEVEREIGIMKKLNHENVIRLFEVMNDPKLNKIYLVLEYMKQGDLMQIMDDQPLDDGEVWDITRQVCFMSSLYCS